MSRRYVKLWVDLWDRIGNPTDWMLFLYLLQRAEVKGNKRVQRGQVLTSQRALSTVLDIPKTTILRSLNRLVGLELISGPLGGPPSTVVTVCDYDKYNPGGADADQFADPSEEDIYIKSLQDLDKRIGTSYQNRRTKDWIKLFNGRRKEGAGLEDFLAVNEVKCKDWYGTDFAKYLTPSTLWRPSKFWNYRESAKVVGKKRDIGVDDLL